ncbi:hypothetical protein [Kribbella sp.]|uniref:hypothetical protein n=1 Tax=Kribbella sp. TaxID=1871183 RepID=UPI002D55F95F|nr:hypothetical protein [Kribbella sp.]HZX08154.1 hypothetical protein [Kribbella sp.]
MNDTENRLREYLQTKATTSVPADSHGPGPELTVSTRRRTWLPVTAVAAALAVTLLAGIPYLTSLAKQSGTAPAGSPTAKALTSAMPSVPYMVQTNDRLSTLEDGDHRIKLPAGTFAVSAARVAGGWVASIGSGTKGYRPAIIGTDGTIRPIGPETEKHPLASPDGKQIAVVPSNINDPSRITIFDVRSGREVDSLPMPKDDLRLHAWTKDGIWASGFKNWNVLTVWQPGKGKRTINLPEGSQLVRASQTGTVLAGEWPDRHNCAKAGTVEGDKFVLTREYCGKTGLMSVDLAPDGRTMVDGGSKASINLTTGAVTKLQLPDKVQPADGVVYEDSRFALVITQKGEDHGSNNTWITAPRQMFRCDVTTGRCKVVVPARSATMYIFGQL